MVVMLMFVCALSCTLQLMISSKFAVSAFLLDISVLSLAVFSGHFYNNVNDRNLLLECA